MSDRGFGEVELAAETMPEWARGLFGELTVLGDTLALALVFLVLYWIYDREAGSALLLLFGVGAVLIAVLKTAIGLPRPPAATAATPVDGYGFPSGHAFNATVAFGMLAKLRPERSPLLRYGLAAVGVSVVGVSRVAIGVHYAIDVVAGIALGVGFLAVAWPVVWPRRGAIVAALDRRGPF